VVLVLEGRDVPQESRPALAAKVRGEILAAMGIRTDEVDFWPLGSIPRPSSGKVRRRECALKHGEGLL